MNDNIDNSLLKLLSVIPENRINALKQRRANWNDTNEKLFKKDPKFNQIKAKMRSGAEFSVMDVDCLCSDMAFLAAFYDHLLELEGIVIAEYALYSRYWEDNMNIIYHGKIFDGPKGEVQAQVLRCVTQMKEIWEILTGIKQDMALLGLYDNKQTPRSESIKMLIEVYKKRHDSKRRQYESSNTR